jgi:hypothetical protein
MTLEDDLRVALRERAAANPPDPQPDLLAGVHGGVRRAHRRRLAMIGAAAVLAVVVAVPVWLAGERSALPTPPAVPSVPVVPSPSAVAWEPPRFEMPTFPLTPSWEPPGVGPGRVGRFGANLILAYEGSGVLGVDVGPVPGSWESEGEEDHRSTVNGRAATVRTGSWFDGAKPGERYVGVRWRLTDGRWVQLISFGPRTEEQVLRFARGLRPGVVPAAPAPFSFAEIPPGLTLQAVHGQNMCFSTRPPAHYGSLEGLCVSVDTESPETPPDPSDVLLTVGGRPARFSTDTLRITLGNHRFLYVRADQETVPLTSDELVRFAGGIRIVG